jgi:hypothetical protein
VDLVDVNNQHCIEMRFAISHILGEKKVNKIVLAEKNKLHLKIKKQ